MAGLQKLSMWLVAQVFPYIVAAKCVNRLHDKKCIKYLFSSYQARAKRGLFTNKEDTIPGPSDSIGAPKIYILVKRIFLT